MARKTMCSFVSSREANLTEKFKSKFPDHKGIRVQQFCEALSSLESNDDINFNYLKLLENGEEDKVLNLVKAYLESESRQASKERLIPPEFTESRGEIRTMKDVVTYVGDKFIAINPTKPMTTEQVKKIVSSYVAMYNIPAQIAGKLKKNIQTLPELRTFALYLAECKRYNSFESDSNKATDVGMTLVAIGKLMDFAKINEGLREIKASRVEIEEEETPKTMLQSSNYKGNKFFTSNPIEGIHTAKDAYIARRQANIEHTDATIMVSQWAPNSPGENGTRGDANKAGKLAGELNNRHTSIKDFVDSIVENLQARKDLNLEEGISLNIAGNSIDKILGHRNQNQDYVNKLIYNILQELQSRGIKINQIVTGGQTGVDEAGIIAAAALKIPYMIRAAAYEFTNNKTGKTVTVYPLRENNNEDTSYYPNMMDKYMGRFNKEAVERVKGGKSSSSNKVQGENITSKGSDFAKRLTNPNPKGFETPIEYKGKKYKTAEHAYQTWKSGEFDEVAYNEGNNGSFKPKGSKAVNKKTSYQTMVDILTAKLEQHPELIDGINERGGIEYLNNSWHKVLGDNNFWEKEGFMKALKEAYNKTNKNTSNIQSSGPIQSSQPVAALAEVNKGANASNWAGNSGYFSGTTSSFNPYENATQEETDNAQNVDQIKTQEQDAKVKEETNRIKSSITVREESPIALLHRAIGKNAPQIIKARMDMFSHLFSNHLTSLVAKYIQEQQAIIDDENTTAYNRDVAKDNINKASDVNDGRAFVLSVAGSRVLQSMKEQFEGKLKVLDVLLQSGSIDFDIYKYRKGQWQIVLDHFDTIFSLAKVLIERNENVKVSNSTQGLKISESSESSEFDEDNHDDNDEGKIAYGNDGWGFKNRESDPHTRMSQAVKKILRDIVKERLGEKGKVFDTDDLGEQTYYNEDELYAVLVREFSKMKEPVDFAKKVEGEFYDNGNPVYDYPIFDGMSAKYPWISKIIEALDNELENTNGTQIISLFYANFRNDFIPYYMNVGGKSNSLNTESAAQSVLNMATTNYEHGIVLSDHSIYNSVSQINKSNVDYWLEQEDLGNKKKGLDRINQLTKFINNFNKLSQANPEDLKSIIKTADTIADLFKSIGLTYSGSEIKTFMDTELGRNLLKDAIANAYAIVSGVSKAKDDINITDDKSFISNYKAIGKALDKVYTEYVQQSFREGDKTRYSYSTPNYIDTITKFLNEENLEKRREYMLDHYGKTEWFYKDGVWRNEVLQRLWDGEKVAFSELKDMPIIQTNELDDRTKHEYENWTPQDINAAFLSEYYQNTDSKSLEIKTSAFYNFPIFSDSPICKLVRMRRYIGNGSKDYTSTFKSEILDKFVAIAEQELWRMGLVRQREGIDKDKKIVNFDISDDWKSRGNQFCFFPALNKMSIETIKANLDNDSFTITFENEKLRDKLNALVIANNSDLDFSELTNLDKEDLLREEYKNLIKSAIESLENKYSGDEQLGNSNSFKDYVEYAVLDNNDFLKQELLKLGIEQSMNESLNTYLDNHDNREGLKTGITNLVNNNKLEEKKGYTDFFDAYRNEIEEYFWNSCFATANIIQLTTTDLAYYKNAVDFQKRYKEVYASGTKLNTQSKYGKEIETSVYLKDNFITVPTYTYLKKSLDDAVKRGDLHESEMKAILSNYRNICQTNAQAFRSVKSVRDVLDMLGQLSPAMDEMFNRMLSGNYEYQYSDFNMLIQTIKPFFFGHDTIKDNISEAGLLMVPHQNKNSEFTLLTSLGMMAGIMNNAHQLKALNDYMIANDIDVVQFESAVKVGGQGIVDINWANKKVEEVIKESKDFKTLLGNDISKYLEENGDIKTGEDVKSALDYLLENDKISSEEYNKAINHFIPNYEETIEILEASIKNTDGSIKEEVVHQHSYGDYMIATATPEHFFDAEAIYGSQFRNIIISDIDEDTEYTVNGQTYKGNELKEHYRKLVTENLLRSFEKVRREFSDIRTLQAKLKSLTAGNPRYDDDLLDALELVKDPKTNKLVFNIPLHNPSTTGKIQELLDSLWKSNVTKQHIKGGAGILVSDFGFSNTLQVVRDENGAIVEIECYMPAYAEAFYREFMNEDGTLRYAEIEEKYPELLKCVGTRIPTEGKYSMLNLKIKGFLPRMNGGAVMLPAEITQTAGSDFDIDKIFIQFPDFKITRDYDNIKLWESFKEEYPDLANKVEEAKNQYVYDEIINYTEMEEWEDALSNPNTFKRLSKYIIKKSGLKEREFDEEVAEKYANWKKSHRDDINDDGKPKYYEHTTFEKYEFKHKFDENGRVDNYAYNTKEAINNEMIDVAFAILSNKAHAVHFSNPGSFDKIKTVARITEILENPKYRQEYMKVNGLKSLSELKEFIMKDTLKNLNKFLDKYGVERDVLSPDTFIYNHKQNMTGAKLIGIYANNNSMQAKFQDTGLALDETHQFRINGRDIDRLDMQKTKAINGVTEIISKNCAEWLAASVDNVKDPILAKLLQNPNSANLAGFLLRAGLSINEVGLFFKQPIIQALINSDDNGSIKRSVVKSLINVLEDKYNSILDKESVFELDDDYLLDRIIEGNGKLAEYVSSRQKGEENKDLVAELSDQDKLNIINLYNMLNLLYDKIIPASDIISEMTRCCRADSPKGGLARTLPMAFNQKVRLMNFWSKTGKYNFPLSNVGAMPRYDLFEGNVNHWSDIDSIRDLLYSQGDGMMLQAFTSLGVVEPLNIMATYFKPFQQEVLDMVADVVRNHDNYRGTLSDDTVNNIFNDLTTYILSKTEMLGDDGELTYDQKRDWYMYEFPKQFMEILNTEGEEYEAIKNLDIIKKLRVYKGELQLNGGANLTQTTRQLLKQSMDSLLYLDSPVAEQLATDLFAYAYYSKGFRFDAFDYAQFFSTNFIKTVAPEVVEVLREFSLKGKDEFEEVQYNLENFKEQLYQNRLSDVAPYFDLRFILSKKELKDSSVIKMPLDLVYNDHMDSEYVDGIEVPIAFPKLNTSHGYYVYTDIDIEGKNVIYTKTNRYRPEGINYATWTKYNANMSAEEMAQNYVDSRIEINKKLEELRELSSHKRRKAKKGASIKSRRNKNKSSKPHNALSKSDLDEVKGTKIVDVNLVEKQELGIDDNIVKTMSDPNADVINVSGFNASESRTAIKAINEADDEVIDSSMIKAVKRADDEIESIKSTTIKAVNAANDGLDYSPSKKEQPSNENYPSEGESKFKC